MLITTSSRDAHLTATQQQARDMSCTSRSYFQVISLKKEVRKLPKRRRCVVVLQYLHRDCTGQCISFIYQVHVAQAGISGSLAVLATIPVAHGLTKSPTDDRINIPFLRVSTCWIHLWCFICQYFVRVGNETHDLLVFILILLFEQSSEYTCDGRWCSSRHIHRYAAVTYRQNPGNEALHGFPTRTVRESVIRIQKPDRSISTEMPVVTKNKFQISGVP